MLKMSRGRSALGNILNSPNDGTSSSSQQPQSQEEHHTLLPIPKVMSDTSWESKKQGVEAWMKSNPLRLGVPNDGTIDIITSQITRGDSFPDARAKCWSHILVELHSCKGVLASLGFTTDTVIHELTKGILRIEKANSSTPTTANSSSTTSPRPSSSPKSKSPRPLSKSISPIPSLTSLLTTTTSTESTSTPQPIRDENSPPIIGGQASKAIFALRTGGGKSHDNLNSLFNTVENETGSPVPKLSLPNSQVSNDESERLASISKSERSVLDYDGDNNVIRSPASYSARDHLSISRQNSTHSDSLHDSAKKAKDEGKAVKSEPTSMIERQELWMAKKAEKEKLRKEAANAAVEASISSAPDTKSSQRSYAVGLARGDSSRSVLSDENNSNSNINSEKSAIMSMISKKDSNLNQINSNSGEPTRRKESGDFRRVTREDSIVLKKDMTAAEKYDSLMKLEKPPLNRTDSQKYKHKWKSAAKAAVTKKKTIMRVNSKSKTADASLNLEGMAARVAAEAAAACANEDLFSPNTARRYSEAESLNESIDDPKVTFSEDGIEAFPLAKSLLGPPVIGASSSSESLVSSAIKEEDAPPLPSPFVPGSFYSRLDTNSNRGQFKVRDGSTFQMNTMYRKRDKFSKRGSSVALLVGREEGGSDEKVIEVLFDMSAMSEVESKAWWEENEVRFSSPRTGEGLRGDDGRVR